MNKISLKNSSSSSQNRPTRALILILVVTDEVVLHWVRTIRIVHYYRGMVYQHTLLYEVRRHNELFALFLLLGLRLLLDDGGTGPRLHVRLHRLQKGGRLLLAVHHDLPVRVAAVVWHLLEFFPE